MAGALAPAADIRVALKAVASIDRLIRISDQDLFLKDVLFSANRVLRAHDMENRHTMPDCKHMQSTLLH